MKKHEVIIGGLYAAKVNNKIQTVRIVSASPLGGWHAVNIATNREITIRTAGRLRHPVEEKS